MRPHGTVPKRRAARRALPILCLVPGVILCAPVLAADLDGAPDNLAGWVARPINRHVVRVSARAARLPVCGRPALRVANARILVPVELGFATDGGCRICKGLALPGKPVTAACA